VGKPAGFDCAAALYVQPGNADASVLYLKITAGANYGCGGVMPPSGAVSPALSALVKSWIEAGAAK
jgi:hypothetical protein